MRPRQGCLERKSFSPDFITGAAELFTEACGELPRALLALGGITLETVSEQEREQAPEGRQGYTALLSFNFYACTYGSHSSPFSFFKSSTPSVSRRRPASRQ